MCGIAGFAGSGARADLLRMTDALRHRGPDGEGFFVDPETNVHLGHRRLAIVDVDTGQQPMWNEDGLVGVVFNGEIYNHAELRIDLERRGHRFSSRHSDTEVLIHGYEEWREELPIRLNGMFAFAILDRIRGRLFLARDRFGEKPLYYIHQPRLLAFASELTALAEHPAVSRSIAPRALQKFFGYGYVPAPHAMLEGTAKLPGGHWLGYDLATRNLVIKPYYQFELAPDHALTDADEPRLVEECAALLTRSARRRLMSDVPLGIFLSGGLDSGLVLATLARHLPQEDLDTFTIGFAEPSFDESTYARCVARHLGSNHHERQLDMAHVRPLISTLLARLDEPQGDASLLATYLLCQFARERVTVALTGDGGDELFAGYDPFVALQPARIYSWMMPAWGHKGMCRLVDLMPISHANMSLDFRLRRALQGLAGPASTWLPAWMAPLDPKDMKELFETPLRLEDLYEEAIALWESDPRKEPVDRALEFFTRYYLQDDILAKVDRASMLNSLETRAVFLDNDLVEFCRKLPHRFKFRLGERKYLLKRVARRLLPPEIVKRRKKGFGVPIAAWLRDASFERPLAPLAGVRVDYARRAFDAHRAGSADHRLFLWSWIALQAFSDRIRLPAP